MCIYIYIYNIPPPPSRSQPLLIKYVFNIDILMRSGSVWMHMIIMGAYGCVMEACEYIRMQNIHILI